MGLNITPTLNILGEQAVELAIANGGLQRLAYIALGRGQYHPTGTEGALFDEVARAQIETVVPQGDHVEITATITAPVDFTIGEVGFLFEDGTPFAVWSEKPSRQYPALDLVTGEQLVEGGIPQTRAGRPLASVAAGVEIPFRYVIDIGVYGPDKITVVAMPLNEAYAIHDLRIIDLERAPGPQTPDNFGGDLAAWAAAPCPKRLPLGIWETDVPIWFHPSFDVLCDVGAQIKEAAIWLGGADDPLAGCLGNLDQLPALAEDAPYGARMLTFASAHGLSAGDTIDIENTVDFSLNGWRSYYHDGEMMRVRAVVSATAVELEEPIDPQGVARIYPATDCVLHRLATRGPKISGLLFRAEQATSALRAEALVGPRFDGVVCVGGKTSSANIRRSFHPVVSGCDMRMYEDMSGTQYALSSGSCQGMLVEGGYFSATQHAIALGMGGNVSKLPNRYSKIMGATLRSWNIQAADGSHGCNIGSQWVNCDSTGYLPGGADSLWQGGILRSPVGNSGVPVYAGEMHNANHRVSCPIMKTSMVGDAAGLRGIFDIGGNSTPFGANTVRGGLIDIDIGKIEAPNWGDRPPIVIRNRGYVGSDWSVRVSVGELDTGVTPASRLVILSHVSGELAQSLTLTNYVRGPVKQLRGLGAHRHYAPSQTVRASAAVAAGATFADLVVPIDYPSNIAMRASVAIIGAARITDANLVPVEALVTNVTQEAVIVRIRAFDGSAFSQAETFNIEVTTWLGGAQ